MDFLSRVPTVWDETEIVGARLADYVIMARKSGEEWYVGAMTDWQPRDLVVDFAFLGEGRYEADIFEDGLNADRHGNDFSRSKKLISESDVIKLKLAPGGGWVARIVASAE
jgi:alpha-glucosidase